MKKIYPEAPDVSQSLANKAIKIVEKHLRLHRASRMRELPEEAKVRLYRDLRFLFEGGQQPPSSDVQRKGFSLRDSFSRLWERIGDFLTASVAIRRCGPVMVFAWAWFGDCTRLTVMAWGYEPSTCTESGL